MSVKRKGMGKGICYGMGLIERMENFNGIRKGKTKHLKSKGNPKGNGQGKAWEGYQEKKPQGTVSARGMGVEWSGNCEAGMRITRVDKRKQSTVNGLCAKGMGNVLEWKA